jgi:altronate hydrolase
VVDVLRYGERQKCGLNLLSARATMRWQPARWPARAAIWCCSAPVAARRTAVCADGENRHQQRTGGEEKHWIDFDAGQLIHGKAMPQLKFVDTIVDSLTAADPMTRNDFRELAIFKSGVTSMKRIRSDKMETRERGRRPLRR